MKVTIDVVRDIECKCTYKSISESEIKELTMWIDNDADIYFAMDGAFLFKTNCLEFKKAIIAFDI